MKIAYVLNTYPQPSHSFIRRELQALERQGFEVSRIAMRPSDSTLLDPGDQAEARQTDYVLQRGGGALLAGFLSETITRPKAMLRAARAAVRLGRRSSVGVLRHLIYLIEAVQVKRRCAADQIEHVHAHFGTNATTVALLTFLLGGPRYSFTTHGPEEFDAPHALSLGEKVNQAKYAVGVSSFGKSQLSRWADFGSWDKIKVVHCGIEPEKFPEPEPMPTGPLRLVAIGRFVEQKGQMILVRALQRAVEQCPDLHLSLIGDGEMRADLEGAVLTAGLETHVTFTGWLSEEGVRKELSAAHALVMPSFAEGLPMVVMEAMASGRPVLATYIAGTPELVVPGQTGWLVPAGDSETLAAAMVQISGTDRSQLEAMGKAGRARVLERHDSAKEAAKLADLFRA